MGDYLAPRRFSRVWEMDRNGPPMCGTHTEQQQARDAIGNYSDWDNPYDRALFALDKAVNATGRSYLVISLFHEVRQSFYGRAGGAVIQLFPPSTREPAQSEWDFVLSHEMGHIMYRQLFNPILGTEDWATQFQWWVMNGQPEFGNVYDSLDSVGAQDSVAGSEGPR